MGNGLELLAKLIRIQLRKISLTSSETMLRIQPFIINFLALGNSFLVDHPHCIHFCSDKTI